MFVEFLKFLKKKEALLAFTHEVLTALWVCGQLWYQDMYLNGLVQLFHYYQTVCVMEGPWWKQMLISLVFDIFKSKQLFLHQEEKVSSSCCNTCGVHDYSIWVIAGVELLQSFVKRVKRSGEIPEPWGAPVEAEVAAYSDPLRSGRTGMMKVDVHQSNSADPLVLVSLNAGGVEGLPAYSSGPKASVGPISNVNIHLLMRRSEEKGFCPAQHRF